MPIIHFLNVKNGACSVIEHLSGRTTVIDVCNAKAPTPMIEAVEKVHKLAASAEKGVNGNFKQKEHPVNPILYMRDRGVSRVFRFILTHPDMDHMDGMKDFFKSFSPANFWDTDNEEEKEFGDGANAGYSEDDKMLDRKFPPQELATFEKGEMVNADGYVKFRDGNSFRRIQITMTTIASM